MNHLSSLTYCEVTRSTVHENGPLGHSLHSFCEHLYFRMNAEVPPLETQNAKFQAHAIASNTLGVEFSFLRRLSGCLVTSIFEE